MTPPTVYFCNPEKNAGCDKIGCAYYTEGEGGCQYTLLPECAITTTSGDYVEAPPEAQIPADLPQSQIAEKWSVVWSMRARYLAALERSKKR